MGYQQGYVYKASGAWHLRYYTTERVKGIPVRVQKSRRVCDLKGHSKSDAKRLAAPFLAELNTELNPDAALDLTVSEFWDSTYEDFIVANKRASTVHGYRQIWKQHLKPQLGDRMLKEYRTVDGTNYLTALARTDLRLRTVQHVQSLASGLWSHAVAIGKAESNPWRDAKILGKVKGEGDTPHYTLEEAENIVSALVEHVDAQLIFALAFFTGMRPGEIGALKWEDFDTGFVHVRRAIGRGVVDEPKTKKSVASLPLIAPVKIPLRLWRAKSGNPASGWVFPNGAGKPTDLRSFTDRVIKPTLEVKKIEWKGLYAGRRGAATILRQLTGNSTAGKELLRHSRTETTEAHYEKAVPEVLISGMRLLEEKTTKL
jgi:integrase